MQIRHIDEVSHISDLIFTDAFSVQALGLDGSELWATTFPNMLIQGYFAFNDSFVFIRNSRSLTADQEVISDGVKLLPGGDQQVDNHVLLALLFSPVGNHPQLPLLPSLPAEEIDRIPAKGVTSSDVWPITKSNLSEGFPSLPLYHGRPRDHSFGHDSVILLAMLGCVFLFYLLYRWATWLFQRYLPKDAVGEAEAHAAIPVSFREVATPMSTSTSTPTPPSPSPDMASMRVIHVSGGDIPVCTGLYHQDFEVGEEEERREA